MNAQSVQVRHGRVEGAVRVPPSKSVTHRALLLAAQADGPSRIRNALLGDDTRATLRGLLDLGARLHLDAGSGAADVLALPAGLRPPSRALDCGNSGTTLRLLAAAAARLPVPVTLTGDASLRSRPNGAFLDALQALGASVRSAAGRAPLTVHGPLRSGRVALPPRTSSQFASALLLSLPFLPGDSSLALQAPVASAPYLAVTEEVAAGFGLRLERQEADGAAFAIPGGQRPRATDFEVEGDWSAAAFPLVAAAITGGRVRVAGLRPDSRQGDRALLDELARFGVRLRRHDDGAEAEGGPLSSPGSVDVSATPDLFPALAVLAAASRGTTRFTGGAALRTKETDRIRAMAEGLSRMGVRAEEAPDGLVVHGGGLRGASVACRGDHRIHMAFAVAGLAATGTTTVDGPSCAAVSYPGFHRDLAALGAAVTPMHGRRAEVSP